MWSETEKKNAADGWTLLRAGGRGATGLEIPTVRTDVSTASGFVRLALGESGEARVLLPLSGRETLTGLRGAPALKIGVTTFSCGGAKKRFLDLTCLSRDLETVFVEVTDEILARIVSGRTCVDAARSTIDDFRALLVRPSPANVPLPKIAGLVGEMIALDRLLDGSPLAWRTWRGPAGDRHDFRCGDISLEVKSTIHAGDSRISVHGFEQMEPPTGGTLYLIHYVLEAVAGGEFNVSSLGHRIVDKADDPYRVKELLASVDCPDIDADIWNQCSFRLEVETLHKVSEGFPRIVPSMLFDGVPPAGVSDVRYRIDLSTATDFVVSPSCFDEIREACIKWL